MFESTVEAAASNTSPPGGPSENQFLLRAGRIARVLRWCRGRNDTPPERFPSWSRRGAAPGWEETRLLEDTAEEVLSTACGEPARAANVLDIAPKPASKTQPMSNTANKPSNTRDFEWNRLEFEKLFIVKF